MNANLLRAELAKNGMTQKELAQAIGMAQSTLYRKIKNNSFGIDDVRLIVSVLHIDNPIAIFFDD